MKRMALQVMFLIVASLLLSLAICQSAVAADTMYYFRLDTANRDLSDSGFNGDRLINFAESPSIFVFIPKIDDSIGYGFTFGAVRGHIGGELYFRYSEHDDNFSTDISYYEIGGNFKYYFAEYGKTAFNGYALAGMAYTRFESKHAGIYGNYDPVTETLSVDNMGGANFKGKVYNLGLGATWQFVDHFGLEAQYLYGFYHTMEIDAFGEKVNRFNDIDGDIQTLSLGMNYFF